VQESFIEPGWVASEWFEFRFVARGDLANALVVLAVESLRWCHPNAAIVLIDANDSPTLARATFGSPQHLTIVHIPPGEDEISRVAGRGSPHHLYYWRHSPQVLNALPSSGRYMVYADSDMFFLRPMDLRSLLGPLARGRIAATIDESSLDYYRELGAGTTASVAAMLPGAGAGGPLLQGGLLISNPDDDGGIYDRFWALAVDVARSGHLTGLPWDDMCLLTALLGQGGPLWERLLPLGHEWDYISDAQKDPGIFGCAAHYGGRRAKAFILAQRQRMLPAPGPGDPADCWGTVAAPGNGASEYIRGPWRPPGSAGSRCDRRPRSVPLPFCLTWRVPVTPKGRGASVVIRVSGSVDSPPPETATFFVYVDGQLTSCLWTQDGLVHTQIPLTRAETLTIIGISNSPGGRVDLEERLDEPLDPAATAPHIGDSGGNELSSEKPA
jgi:hypothetical protein